MAASNPCHVPADEEVFALRDEEAKKHPNYKFWEQDEKCGICGAPLKEVGCQHTSSVITTLDAFERPAYLLRFWR